MAYTISTQNINSGKLVSRKPFFSRRGAEIYYESRRNICRRFIVSENENGFIYENQTCHMLFNVQKLYPTAGDPLKVAI